MSVNSNNQGRAYEYAWMTALLELLKPLRKTYEQKLIYFLRLMFLRRWKLCFLSEISNRIIAFEVLDQA